MDFFIIHELLWSLHFSNFNYWTSLLRTVCFMLIDFYFFSHKLLWNLQFSNFNYRTRSSAQIMLHIDFFFKYPTSCFEIYSSVIWMLCRTYLIPTVGLMLINDQFCCLLSTEAQLISLDDLVLCAAHEAEVQRMPRLNQPLQSDGDPAGASDHSDVGPASPAKQSNSSQSGTPQRSSSQSGTPQRSSSQSGTPQRSSHLSIPSAVASSHTGSIDEVVS